VRFHHLQVRLHQYPIAKGIKKRRKEEPKQQRKKQCEKKYVNSISHISPLLLSFFIFLVRPSAVYKEAKLLSNAEFLETPDIARN